MSHVSKQQQKSNHISSRWFANPGKEGFTGPGGGPCAFVNVVESISTAPASLEECVIVMLVFF
jgi:hypothetical protein